MSWICSSRPIRDSYTDLEIARLHRAAAAIEARHHRRETRLGEIILFARELGCRRIGLVLCIGLADEARRDLNVLCGLCVGHDAIVSKLSDAPVTTLVAKDRVLAHNPLGAVYCQYVRRDLLPPD